MFLKMLDLEGSFWAADLRVIRSSDGGHLLEFCFTRQAQEGNPDRVTWQVRGDSLEALSEEGADISEDLLRRHLAFALRQRRSVGAHEDG